MTAIPWAGDRPLPARSRAAAGTARGRLPSPWTVGLPLLSSLLVLAGVGLGWRGGDFPAQIYRVEQFRHHGFALWDSQWYAGHWTLGYSVGEPALAALTGLSLLSVVCAAIATAGFHRLVADHLPTGAARAAALVFAVSVIVETAIGQIPFLAGEAVGVWACVALGRRRPVPAVFAAAVASLLSPLAAAFVALAAASVALAAWWPSTGDGRTWTATWWTRARRPGIGTAVAVLVAIGLPLGAVGLLFPGQGPMPFSVVDAGWDLLIAATLLVLTPRHERVLRTGIPLYAVVIVLSLAFPSALGGNVGRIEDCMTLPLAVGLLWSRRRLVVIALVAVPLVLSQWGPAWGAMASDAGHAWTTPGFYAPLTAYLHRVMGPGGRVEVVPTAEHWESAYVAPSVELARGWERQLDVADNPLFYDPDDLTQATYLDWLINNGVRYVALPSAPLDFAGRAEGRMVAAGVPGLRPVWHSAAWRVFAVDGATGIVSGPGYLAHIEGSKITVVARQPGTIEVRVHDNPGWQVTSGVATLDASDDGWILVNAVLPGPIDLSLGLAVP